MYFEYVSWSTVQSELVDVQVHKTRNLFFFLYTENRKSRSYIYRLSLSAMFLTLTGLTKVRHLVPPRDWVQALVMAATLTVMPLNVSDNVTSSTYRDAFTLGSISILITYLATRYDAIRGERVNIIRWFSLRDSKIGYGTAGYLDETISTCYYVFLSVSWTRIVSPIFQDLLLYPTMLFAILLLRRAPVSLPGGPRQGASRIRREPVWCSKDWEFQGEDWTFVGASRSHEMSKRQNCKFKLSGESSGRQTWWNDGDKTVSSKFMFNPAKNPNTSDRVFREQQIKSWKLRHKNITTTTTTTTATTPTESKGGTQDLRARATRATIKAIEYFQMLQCEDGHWAGDYGGPHFLLPGLVIVWYVFFFC